MRPVERGSASLVMGIIGVIFAIITLAFGWGFLGEELRTAWQLRRWVQVPGALVEVSGHPRGVGAAYHYEFAGRRYDGTRIGLYDGWSGREFNARHIANYRTLRTKLEASGPVRSVRNAHPDGHTLRALGAGAQISLWVDPVHPEQAMIDPTVDWGRLRAPLMILGVLFAAGLAVAAFGFFGGRGVTSEQSAQALQVRRPIHGTSHRFPTALWAIGIVWTASVAVVASDFRPIAGREILASLALALFAAAGLFILWRALVASLRWQRYREVAVELESYPAETGSVLAGTLVVPVPHRPAQRFGLVLTCTEHGLHGGKLRKNNSYARELFRREAQAHVSPALKGTRVSFRIPIPHDAPASEGYLESLVWTHATAGRVFVRWSLEVRAAVDGIDLKEAFEVPVRRGRAVATQRAGAATAVPQQTTPAIRASSAQGLAGSPADAGAARSRSLPVTTAPAPERGGWATRAGLLLVALVVGYQAWPFLQSYVRTIDSAEDAKERSDDRAHGTARPAKVPLALSDWRASFQRASQAALEQRSQDAIRHYREALTAIEHTRGAHDPLAAVMLERIGAIHTESRSYAEAESALRRSLEILERHSHDAVRAEAGKLVLGFDRESVLRKLGWALWELRRYPESLAHYQRAYDTVAELDLGESSRNYRLAYNAAGIMVGACTQREWERAERAMAELKQRMTRLAERDRRWLEYWVRTGEPRLAARQC